MNDGKQLYKECADLIPNWRKKSISELANSYVDTLGKDDLMANAYLSAVIYKMWQTIENAYYKQQYKFASFEDLYDATIESIMYALEHHVWTDPDNPLYGDPIGPEKAINVRVKCAKLNVFEFLGRHKRRLNNGILSLEEIQADKSEGIFLPYRDADVVSLDFIYNKIIYFFEHKEYFKAFAMFGILTCNVYKVDTEEGEDYSEFSLSSLRKSLHEIDESFCCMFACDMDIPIEDVINASTYVKDLSPSMIDTRFNNLMRELRSDKEFINLLKGGKSIDI